MLKEVGDRVATQNNECCYLVIMEHRLVLSLLQDSSAYFVNLLWNYFSSPGVRAPEQLVNEAVIFDAVSLAVDTWITEQRHDNNSNYRWAHPHISPLFTTYFHTFAFLCLS